jgi:hypothetical protein
MRAEEYLIASRAIHIELERLANRIHELARFRCADPSNHAFMNLMERQAELFDQLSELHTRAAEGFKNSARAPLV